MSRRSSPTAPRITPQNREPKAQLNVRVAARTLTLVREYATFIESGLDYTVNAALLLALEGDAAFQAWRTTRESQPTPIRADRGLTARDHRSESATD